MGSFSEDEETRFFDAGDGFLSMSDSDVDDCGITNLNCGSDELVGVGFDVWTRSPKSVEERRSKFLNLWFSDGVAGQNAEGLCETDLLEEDGNGELLSRISGAEDRFCSTRTLIEDQFCTTRISLSSMSDGKLDCNESTTFEDNSVCRGKDMDGLSGGKNVGIRWNGRVDGAHEVESVIQSVKMSALTPLCQHFTQRAFEKADDSVAAKKKVKKGLLSRLCSFTHIMDNPIKGSNLRPCVDDATIRPGLHRVKVHHGRKRSKELSALYMGQEIKAHKGSISAMKFSLDGQYLASAGQDGIVRVWKVVEEERSNELGISDVDPSSMYFKVNQLSQLTPIFLDNEKKNKIKSLTKAQDSACVIFPPKVFRILEKPLHEFSGHDGEILDLTWSNNNFLLSSSMDNTVRLWRVGYDHCLKVFLHTNYVTCIQLNPAADDYFVSGSIDGKVRIWSIPKCQVIAWTEIKEIVTAVFYQPDGQGVIVGSITGNCRFYSISDNHLQMDSEICLISKKSSCKGITGFQFYPQDHSRVMVTCADSSVRVLQGHKVISKYKGLHNAASHLSASFCSDGKHLVSACEDSNVYMWNCIEHEKPVVSQAKKIRSCEHFSANASVAIPWGGFKHRNSVIKETGNSLECHISDATLTKALPLSSPRLFFLSQGLIDSYSKGSATWPEENLPKSSPSSTPFTMQKSQYNFLKSSCQSICHAWGLVILTAGWDGHIRSYYNYGLPVTT